MPLPRQKRKLPTSNEVRIIGGSLRSRKITFPNAIGLRPTPNRVRETLFNWLAPCIAGARCLDLFAGSGALGFEAVSRGASHVVMVDQSPEVIKKLRENAALLRVEDRVDIHCTNVLHAANLLKNTTPFDIVFLDPPFHQNYLEKCVQLLTDNALLAKDARIYIEAESSLRLVLPADWEVLRSQKAGQVRYYLYSPGISHTSASRGLDSHWCARFPGGKLP